jgi:hypothetical protein
MYLTSASPGVVPANAGPINRACGEGAAYGSPRSWARPGERVRLPALAAALLAILASGCATIEAPASGPQVLTTVGIVSAVGDKLTLTQAGLTGLADNDRRVSKRIFVTECCTHPPGNTL